MKYLELSSNKTSKVWYTTKAVLERKVTCLIHFFESMKTSEQSIQIEIKPGNKRAISKQRVM